MSNSFGVSINLKQIAVSQIRNLNFNSMCVFNGNVLASGDAGLFTIDTAETDNGTKINSIVELVTTNFNYLGNKRFRKAYIGYETSGYIKISIKVDESDIFKSYILPTTKTDQTQHRDLLPLTRDQKGTYWTFKIENIDGVDFSVDHIEGLPVILTKGRR